MNNKLPPLWLVVGLMMFPQIVETIYSPVLTHIASQFRVSEGRHPRPCRSIFWRLLRAWSAGADCAIWSGGVRHAGGADDLWHRHSAGIAGHSI